MTWHGKRYQHRLAALGVRTAQKSIKPRVDMFTKAKNRFGTTTNPAEAGFILPDGSMLDLSDGHPDQKWLGHEEVTIIPEIESTYHFIESGAIRISMIPSKKVLLLQIFRPLTNSQKQTLGKIIREYSPEIQIDVNRKPYFDEKIGGMFIPSESIVYRHVVFPSQVFADVEELTTSNQIKLASAGRWIQKPYKSRSQLELERLERWEQAKELENNQYTKKEYPLRINWKEEKKIREREQAEKDQKEMDERRFWSKPGKKVNIIKTDKKLEIEDFL